MRTYRITLFAFLIVGAWPLAHAESAREANRRGIEAYKKGVYEEADKQFSTALEKAPDQPMLNYNQGAAKAMTGKLDEALGSFQRADDARDANIGKRSRFAQGVIQYAEAEQALKAGKIEDAQKIVSTALQSNRDVLVKDPSDQDARVNYELTKRLEQQIEQAKQQQQQNKDQSKDQKDQDKNKQDQKNQDQQQKQDQKDQNKQDQNQDQNNKDQQSQDQKKDRQQKDEKKDQQQQSQNGTATPTPSPQSQQNKSDNGQSQATPSPKPSEGGQQADGKPSEQDASANLLNLLDDNDMDAVKRMLEHRYGTLPQPTKDW
jgi:Ca-activated chloride channel family protein